MLKNLKKNYGKEVREYMSSLGSYVSEPKYRKALLFKQKLRLALLSEGCQQLQKCGREEEILRHQLKEGEAVRWTAPLQAAWKTGTTSFASQPPALSSVLTAYSSQTQLQFEFVFQRSKCKCRKWGLIFITGNERDTWSQEKKDLRKGWVLCSALCFELVEVQIHSELGYWSTSIPIVNSVNLCFHRLFIIE